MSLAWGSLVLVVVLLPGVLFFFGLYIPEKFTRDVTERSALGQLAGVLLISVIVHGAFYAAAPLFCGWRPSAALPAVPCVDIERFLAALTLDRAGDQAVRRVAASISGDRYWILLYVVASAAAGVALGWLVGHRVVKGNFSFLTQHRWVYKLSLGDRLTTAWVLTNIREGNRVLMYRGFPRAFHLKRDGTFSYVVLEHVRRGYLVLGEKAPFASESGRWPPMGQSTRTQERTDPIAHRRRYVESLFAIEGEDIANVVFDRYSLAFSLDLSDAVLTAAMRSAMDAMMGRAGNVVGVPGVDAIARAVLDSTRSKRDSPPSP